MADVSGVDPTAGIRAISGVRVHDIGQGDSISVLSDAGKPFMQIDYGGRVGNPFGRAGQIDSRIPVSSEGLLMLTHWDEDHWCSAARGSLARAASWLVPRQTTSPRAVKFSTTLPRINCVPERMVGEAYAFTTEHGDQIWWEKIAAAPDPSALKEDCNHTGIGLSIVKHSERDYPAQVILLPGDAPFGEISHYWNHLESGSMLRGIVAFHHGTSQHWTPRTVELLHDWDTVTTPVDVVFSCARNNSYGHPHKQVYSGLPYKRKLRTTPGIRRAKRGYYDILF